MSNWYSDSVFTIIIIIIIIVFSERMEEMPWLYLTCDLPPPPLYPDEMRENIIPQIPFSVLLSKFNGINEKEYKTYKDSHMKRFEITHLPPYIIIYIKVSLLKYLR